jgi:ribosomal protein S18 acetylase RimI-like enzyme
MSQVVRPFQATDREALLTIGSETAFFGAPIEAFMEDRRVFEDAFFSYYTDYEPEHAWVACDDSRVIGFLTGCTDTKKHDRVFQRQILPAVFWKWLRGKYHSGRKTMRFALALAKAELQREVSNVDLSVYPAHLHINLLPAWRGKGLGRGLMECYLQQLQEGGVIGVHLTTTSYNEAACKLYEAIGFRLLEEHPTQMYAHLVNHPINNRCYGMKLR